ncbi:hypothetical protein GCM10010468_31770 [Actinocorallia longicatena]|uniref:Uncharacterized protein n=1 Tax=Actinocorallia longicatena TaxID=111803 RepID=A0ABP6Q9X8_9ACTN
MVARNGRSVAVGEGVDEGDDGFSEGFAAEEAPPGEDGFGAGSDWPHPAVAPIRRGVSTRTQSVRRAGFE